MSVPPAGNYYIINEQIPSDGTLLAVTFNGKGAVLTVTELTDSPNQLWTIVNSSGSTQRLVPEEATDLQASLDTSNSTVKVTSGSGAYWNIRGNDDIYTIETGNFTASWGLQTAEVGQEIYYGSDSEGLLQNWRLIAA